MAEPNVILRVIDGKVIAEPAPKNDAPRDPWPESKPVFITDKDLGRK